jgi:hypothetical protein
MRGAIPSLPQYVLIALCLVKHRYLYFLTQGLKQSVPIQRHVIEHEGPSPLILCLKYIKFTHGGAGMAQSV